MSTLFPAAVFGSAIGLSRATIPHDAAKAAYDQKSPVLYQIGKASAPAPYHGMLIIVMISLVRGYLPLSLIFLLAIHDLLIAWGWEARFLLS